MKRKVIVLNLILLMISCSFSMNCFVKIKASDTISEINKLIEYYSHNLVYKKESTIYLNETSSFELTSIFHANSGVLERTTYYSHDELWMTNGEGKYSYYGTDEDGNLTHDTVNYIGETSNKIAIKDVSMEEHYYTLKDLVAVKEQNWTLNAGIYSSSNMELIEWFKGFTAPCYLGFNDLTANYIDFERVEIEEIESGLEFRLVANESEKGKLKNDDNVFSKAYVTFEHIDDQGELIKAPNEMEEGTIKHTCLECGESYTKTLYSIDGTEIDTYPSLSNADVINFQGNIITYGGSPDGINRTNKVYCFNTYSNKLYELNVTLEKPSTSHRCIVFGEKVYIFGGLNSGTRFDTIQVHDLKNNTLTTLETRMPFGANCFQVGRYYDKAYFVAGYITGGATNKIYEFDFNTLEMTLLEETLPTNIFKGGWCYFSDSLYVVGGTNGSRVIDIYKFNMRTHKVETMNAKLPYKLSQCRVAYDGINNLYIFGGTNESGKLMSDVFVYNINNDSLNELEFDLPLGIANTCVSNVNGKIYVLGGDNDTVNTILRLDENGFTQLIGD